MNLQKDEKFVSRIWQKLKNELPYSWIKNLETDLENKTITIVVTTVDKVEFVTRYLKYAYRKIIEINNKSRRLEEDSNISFDGIYLEMELKKCDTKASENAQFEGMRIKIRIVTLLQKVCEMLMTDFDFDKYKYKSKEVIESKGLFKLLDQLFEQKEQMENN